MSTTATPPPQSPPPFPAETTAPKYHVPSSITPIPRLPKESRSAQGFGWAGVITAILGVVFGAVKEMGGIPAALAFLRGLSPLTILALAVVFTVVGGVLFGMQVLKEIRISAETRDDRIVAVLNEVAHTQAQQGGDIRGLRTVVGSLQEAVDGLREAIETTPSGEPIQPRRSGQHERIDPNDTAPPAKPRTRKPTSPGGVDETDTGRYRRLGKNGPAR